MKKTLIVTPVFAIAAALSLTACSGSSDPSSSTSGTVVNVVASTNVYGSIAKTIGGDHVKVTSLIDDYSQDPHDYEPSAADKADVQNAQLLIENGGDYDPFFDNMIKSVNTSAPVINAAKLSPNYPTDGTLEGFNEHVFYNVGVMEKVANEIASDLASADPVDASTFKENAQTFTKGISDLQASLSKISDAHAGEGVFVTEPLPLYLTDEAGLVNKTPNEFSEATEEGTDVSPTVLNDSLKIIASGDVKVFITNVQAGGPSTVQAQNKATESNVPVIAFSELVPPGDDYLTWMQTNINNLSRALNG